MNNLLRVKFSLYCSNQIGWVKRFFRVQLLHSENLREVRKLHGNMPVGLVDFMFSENSIKSIKCLI
jgi:hypothetical protein